MRFYDNSFFSGLILHDLSQYEGEKNLKSKSKWLPFKKFSIEGSELTGHFLCRSGIMRTGDAWKSGPG